MTTLTERRPRRDAIENRDALLDAATTVLADDPHAPISTIARTAGLTRRAVYGHFADRDELVRAVFARGATRFNAIAAQVVDDDPRVALARLTALLWSEASHVQATAALALDDAHVADTAAALAPLRSRVRAIAAAGAADGTLRGDVPVDILARLIEQTARAALTALDAPRTPGARGIAVRAVLGIAGLSWREAAALTAEHPELEEAR